MLIPPCNWFDRNGRRILSLSLSEARPFRKKLVQTFALDPERRLLNQLCGVLQIQFFLNVFPVNLDGFGADLQLVCHLARFMAAAEQLEDFELAIAQSVDERIGRLIFAEEKRV